MTEPANSMQAGTNTAIALIKAMFMFRFDFFVAEGAAN